ncbi:hypothetical protein [Ideonella sp. A 288]|uniref:hypothetical protein n=1 Tax=Ideonella sp. A 288 TaxID=1962181 RepID=UPI001186D164|nr:hypothetical protein [Ideonella sp. A 288]
MNRTSDPPPILRFLVMFAALLAAAMGLAALSQAGEQSRGGAEPVGVRHAVSTDERATSPNAETGEPPLSAHRP